MDREIGASIGQRLLWMLGHYRGAHVLNCPLLCRLRGPFAARDIERAIEHIVRRHEALRTTVHRQGRRLVQRIHAHQHVVVDIGDLPSSSNDEATLRDAMAAELTTAIDPSIQPLRARLWRLREDDQVLCLNLHHLVTDAWSTAVIFQELAALLTSDPGGATLPSVSWQYADFVRWQDALIDSPRFAPLRNYWRDQLTGTELPALGTVAGTGRGRPRRTASHVGCIDRPVIDALDGLARSRRTTMFAALFAAFFALLHRETDQTDLAVASVFANRLQVELKSTVGFVANPVAVRGRIDGGGTAVDLLRATTSSLMGAFVHQGMPLHLLPAELTSRGARRLDDVAFQLIPPAIHAIRHGTRSVEPLVPEAIGSRFELELTIVSHEERLEPVLFYNCSRFDSDWASGFLRRYQAIVAEIARDPHQRVGAMPLPDAPGVVVS